MSKLFGTDGIRGKAGEEMMNEAMALRLGSAMAGYSKATGKIPGNPEKHYQEPRQRGSFFPGARRL
jgi:hypothetical protein